MLATFLEEHAGAELSLQVENRAQILRMLGDNEIDIAIMGVPPEFLDAVAVPFADHPHGIVLRGDHALASRSRLQISDFAEDAFLVREPGSGTRAVMERYFASQSFSPRKVIQMTGNEAVKQAVLAGLGVGFLSLNTIGLERGLGLVNVPIVAGLPVVRRWHVVHRRGKQLLPIAQAFRDFVRDEGGRYAEASSSPPPARDPARDPKAALGATITSSVVPVRHGSDGADDVYLSRLAGEVAPTARVREALEATLRDFPHPDPLPQAGEGKRCKR